MRTFLKKMLILITKKKQRNFKNIATLRIKNVADVCSPVLANIWNEEICLTKIFQKILNWQMLHLLLKKDKTFVENYRPVSALPTVSKIFEQIMQKQITDYLGKILSPFLCE